MSSEEGNENKVDNREHLNIVFIGHVDAGKSTITGQLLLKTGQIDARTIQKYEQEAKDKNRDSWYLAYILDTNEEERAKGKTVEVGRANFSTANKRYTLLDAPGHKNYVPNMIGGAAQADVGVLVISARRGEFETGFDRGGQTREHAMLAKTLGIAHLIVLINKMDEKTVLWNKERYDEIQNRLSPFLKKWGFNVARDVIFCPCSGFTGANLLERVSSDVCNWYNGPALLEILDSLAPIKRDAKGGVRIPVLTKFKDMGALCVLGKLESGTLTKDSKLTMLPQNQAIKLMDILVDEKEVEKAEAGENVLVKVKGIEEEDIHPGFVLCEVDRPCKVSNLFQCQVVVLDLLPHKPIITIGYNAVLHLHTANIECSIEKIISRLSRKTGKVAEKKPKFLKSGSIAIVNLRLKSTLPADTYKEYPSMGRFTVRDEGTTILVGKILKIAEKNPNK